MSQPGMIYGKVQPEQPVSTCDTNCSSWDLGRSACQVVGDRVLGVFVHHHIFYDMFHWDSAPSCLSHEFENASCFIEQDGVLVLEVLT